MTTPEGKVKAKVRAILDDTRIWSFWPVPSGYQAASLDVLCAVRVKNIPVFFAIETKAPGKGITDRQGLLIEDLELRLNAKVFVIDGEEGLEELRAWLKKILG